MNSDTFPHNMTQSSNIRIREPVKPETYSYLVDRSVLKKEETLLLFKKWDFILQDGSIKQHKNLYLKTFLAEGLKLSNARRNITTKTLC